MKFQVESDGSSDKDVNVIPNMCECDANVVIVFFRLVVANGFYLVMLNLNIMYWIWFHIKLSFVICYDL